MSGIYDVTLAAGASERILVPGHRVKVIAAPAGAVRIRTSQGEQMSLLEGQGFHTIQCKEFAFIIVTNTSATTQGILVFVGDDGFEDGRIAGSVSIIDQIYGNTLADGASSTAITAFTATQLIAPSTNVRGVIIHAASSVALAGAGGSCIARLVAAPVAPVSTSTPFSPGVMLTSVVSQSNTDPQKSENFALARRLPVAWGLWALFGVNVANATSCSAGGSWTIL